MMLKRTLSLSLMYVSFNLILKVQYVVTTKMQKLPFNKHIKNARQAEKAIHESWTQSSQPLLALALAQKAKKTGK
jgi:hypothetical protein